MPFADIAVPAPIFSPLTYRVPEGSLLEAGMRVVVPFHRRCVVGLCLERKDRPPEGMEEAKIREAGDILDERPILAPPLLKLVRWIASYYCAPIGEVCRAALPARALALPSGRAARTVPPLEIAPLLQSAVRFTPEQSKALELLAAATQSGAAQPFLLEGITGSGKTEVYLHLLEALVAEGRQGLLLVPEIGLTPQLTGRAAAHFGGCIAISHSGLSDAQRHAEWLRVLRGEADVVVGTRSALFAPLARLGAIIVDEEHDGSYKQDDGVTYSGRDGAVMRAHFEKIPVLLGSATPSLESLANARRGKYVHLRLTKRPTGAPLPTVEIVDMRAKGKSGSRGREIGGTPQRRELAALSPELYDAISSALRREEQVLLFAGRRGFAGSLQCFACGQILSCPNCDIALSPHQGHSVRGEIPPLRLVCHYCNFRVPAPSTCTTCGHEAFVPVGHGTERLEAEIADFFPKARVARFDSDSASSPLSRKKILEGMRRGEIDILIGTQMVTKGHDFPAVTLVGVVSADVALAIPDFRSAERTFQLLTQVAGRAGRRDKRGRVIIQTRQPEHYSIQAAREHDMAAFAERELGFRSELCYPPAVRIASVRLSSTSQEKVTRAAGLAAQAVKRELSASGAEKYCTLLGPAPAPIAKLRGRFRAHMLLKSPTPELLTKVLSSLRASLHRRLPAGVRLAIDVDPLNLL